MALTTIENSLENVRRKAEKVLSSETNEPIRQDAANETRFYEDDEKRIKNEGLSQDIRERKKYAKHIFWMVASWLACMMLVLFYQGFGWFHKNISDAVLLALIGSTTLNVLTFFVIVTKYLFPGKKEDG